MNNELEYLGIPVDETEWLKYKGECIIFAGVKKIIDDDENEDEWIMETEDETKNRLSIGLLSVGVICDDIIFKWCDKDSGQRICECICYYNKPYQIYNSEFCTKPTRRL
jgi:hypothetical protein